jgi:hypothetical protein
MASGSLSLQAAGGHFPAEGIFFKRNIEPKFKLGTYAFSA